VARTRQKSKQRKAKRLEQQRKAQGTTGQKPPSNPAEQAVVEQAEAYELGDVLEEAGGDADVAADRVEVEQSDEAIKPVRADGDAATGDEEAEESGAAQIQVGERIRRGRAERAARKEEERNRAERAKEQERKRAERKRPAERRREPRAERKREPGQRGRVVTFLISVWAELRRVQWPSRNQVTQATAVVLVFCLIAGAYLSLGDWVFNQLIKAIL
jgi:preprotein translocase subunit SecE